MFTFPAFIDTTQSLLDLIVLRWNQTQDATVKKKIIQLLGQWLTWFWKSDFENQPVSDLLRKFLDSLIQSEDRKSFDYLVKLIDKMSADQITTKAKKKLGHSPETLWKSSVLLKKEQAQSLLEFHPEEVARQVKLKSFDISVQKYLI